MALAGVRFGKHLSLVGCTAAGWLATLQGIQQRRMRLTLLLLRFDTGLVSPGDRLMQRRNGPGHLLVAVAISHRLPEYRLCKSRCHFLFLKQNSNGPSLFGFEDWRSTQPTYTTDWAYIFYGPEPVELFLLLQIQMGPDYQAMACAFSHRTKTVHKWFVLVPLSLSKKKRFVRVEEGQARPRPRRDDSHGKRSAHSHARIHSHCHVNAAMP